jgi:3-dehydroquinate dehydratase-2
MNLMLMKKILIVNGPNLNLLGNREPDIYGKQNFDDYFAILQHDYTEVQLSYFQSNIEGEIITKIQEAAALYDGIIINPAGYSHSSVAIADAIKAIDIPVIEVHISNIHAREEYRKFSITGAAAKGVISGFGLSSYAMAIHYFIQPRLR